MSKRGRHTDDDASKEEDNYMGETELHVGSDEEDLVDFDKEEAAGLNVGESFEEDDDGDDDDDDDDGDDDAEIDAYFAKIDPTAGDGDARQMDTQLLDNEEYTFGTGRADEDEENEYAMTVKTQVAAPAMWWHTAMNDSERAEIDARAEADAMTMEPAPSSPPHEKLLKVATKRAIQRITRAPSSFIVYSTKRRQELPASMSFKEKAQLISQEYRNLNEEQSAELEGMQYVCHM